MGDFIVVGILALIVGFILYRMIRNKKNGKTACGCDCSSCSKACSSKK